MLHIESYQIECFYYNQFLTFDFIHELLHCIAIHFSISLFPLQLMQYSYFDFRSSKQFNQFPYIVSSLIEIHLSLQLTIYLISFSFFIITRFLLLFSKYCQSMKSLKYLSSSFHLHSVMLIYLIYFFSSLVLFAFTSTSSSQTLTYFIRDVLSSSPSLKLHVVYFSFSYIRKIDSILFNTFSSYSTNVPFWYFSSTLFLCFA